MYTLNFCPVADHNHIVKWILLERGLGQCRGIGLHSFYQGLLSRSSIHKFYPEWLFWAAEMLVCAAEMLLWAAEMMLWKAMFDPIEHRLFNETSMFDLIEHDVLMQKLCSMRSNMMFSCKSDVRFDRTSSFH